jgi:excisionase family DNA binding protein
VSKESMRLLTVREVSELTGWKEATVRARVLRRAIPFYKLGRSVRIAEDDLRAMLERSRVPARAAEWREA